jgi:hypothetical protein
MKAIKMIIAIVGSVGLLYAGYLLLSVPDVRRYIKISTM